MDGREAVQLALAREVVADDFQELGAGHDPGDAAAELSGPGQPLGVGAGELPHQERAPLHAEPAADKVVVVEHDLPLLGERRVRRRRVATEQGRHLGEDPGAGERLAGDHHTVHAALSEPTDGRLGRVDVAVAHHGQP